MFGKDTDKKEETTQPKADVKKDAAPKGEIKSGEQVQAEKDGEPQYQGPDMKEVAKNHKENTKHVLTEGPDTHSNLLPEMPTQKMADPKTGQVFVEAGPATTTEDKK